MGLLSKGNKMEDTLQALQKLVSMLKADSSTAYKKAVLKKYGVLSKGILAKIYDKKLPFNITSKSLHYNILKTDRRAPFDLHQLLFNLSHRVWTGDLAVYNCEIFISANYEYRFLIKDILDKDLKCGINVKTINAVWPELIYDFASQVPLASKYDEKKVDLLHQTWYASRKVDGVRCLCFIEEHDVTFYSRNGKVFETLDVLELDIRNTLPEFVDNVVLDGEICLVDEDGNENFQDIMKQIRRHDHTIERPKFFVFDTYLVDSFKAGVTQPVRYKFEEWINRTLCCELLKQTLVESEEHLQQLITNIEPSWEGLMLKKYPTQFKRSTSLLKIKKFHEDEFIVHGYSFGKKSIDGIQTSCLASVSIKVDNCIVGVGSGFTDDDRLKYYSNPELILGRKITVQYFEKTADQSGKISLRFPTFKGVREYE